jgi:hypothetical protein
MTNVRAHDPFSPHIPPVVFQVPVAGPTEQERRDAALKELAIAEHAAVPAKPADRKPAARKAPARKKRARPTKADVAAALAKLEQSS